MVDGGRCQPLEEQTLPLYHQKRYYPVKIGEVFKNQYRIIAKLGYGAYSTIWLARDERFIHTPNLTDIDQLRCRSKQYTSLKVCVQDDAEASPVINEVRMLRRLGKFAQDADHPGLDFTRLASDIFEIDGQFGRHHCIATKPQGSSLRTLQETFTDAILPKILVKSLIHRLLFSINWLHATCGVVHTDISPQNVLTEAEDELTFRDIEEKESREPSIPTTSDGALVYKSRATMEELSGIPVLTDFGQMRLAEPINKDWWMPDLYRAPEVLLGLPWGFPVDVWSVGVMTLELLEGKNLFDPIDHVHDQYVLPLALVQYVGYLGPPPLEVIMRSPLFSTYFDEEGNWISEPPVPKTSFEDFVTTIAPGDEKELFLKFVRKMLVWDPEVRATSNEIIADEWLMMPVDDIEGETRVTGTTQ
ncbi:hypothetical protein LTR66_007669 [Elasticomyces elasticus]|nr:hypothetical protein LTR66_007669 [Elasticomyces elasticus]